MLEKNYQLKFIDYQIFLENGQNQIITQLLQHLVIEFLEIKKLKYQDIMKV